MQALSNVEILERALAKARANNPDWKPLVLDRPEDLIQMGHENMVLFNRGFALAFWGEAPHIVVSTDSGSTLVQDLDKPAWRYHLQELAVAPDLFAYLAKFL
jgi:hypothetical protein